MTLQVPTDIDVNCPVRNVGGWFLLGNARFCAPGEALTVLITYVLCMMRIEDGVAVVGLQNITCRKLLKLVTDCKLPRRIGYLSAVCTEFVRTAAVGALSGIWHVHSPSSS